MDRRTLLRDIESVMIAKSTRGRWQPISERVSVRWKGGVEPVVSDRDAVAA